MDIYRFRLPGFERPFGRQNRSKAFVVTLQTGEKSPARLQETSQEIHELAGSAGMRALGRLEAFIPQPSPSHFLREGKLAELREGIKKTGSDIAVFSIDLSPAQAGNVESSIGVPVIDRTGLILEIFGRRAQSREGKLQVELAQLHYALPRIGGLGTVMSRLGGGIGTRGPGEQELERDKRKIRRRILQVKEELKKVARHRSLIRTGRKRKNIISIALVGYTNAGKSTLLNALTGANVPAENKLFATLDPKARLAAHPTAHKIVFIDTVGFIHNLPHTLVESFQATLEEASHADLLIHVLDVTSPQAYHYQKTVEKVLKEIKAAEKPLILALNKTDLLPATERERLQQIWPEGILVSARNQWGLSHLHQALEDRIKQIFA